MRNEDDITRALTGLLGMLSNAGKQDGFPPQSEPSQTHGIFIKKEGGKNIEKIIITTAVDACQRYSDKIRSEKSAAAKAAHSASTTGGDSRAHDSEKNSAEKEFGAERSRCFDEVIASVVPETLQKTLNSKITSTSDSNIIEIMVPGVEKEDLELSIETGKITVSTGAEKTESDSYVSSFSAFNSSVSFEIDEEKFNMENIKAAHKNGVLTITIPLKEQPKNNVRKVDIL